MNHECLKDFSPKTLPLLLFNPQFTAQTTIANNNLNLSSEKSILLLASLFKSPNNCSSVNYLLLRGHPEQRKGLQRHGYAPSQR